MTDYKYTIQFPRDVEINVINAYAGEYTHKFTLRVQIEEKIGNQTFSKEVEKIFKITISNSLDKVEIKEMTSNE